MVTNLFLAGLSVEINSKYDLFSVKTVDYHDQNEGPPSVKVNVTDEDIWREYMDNENHNSKNNNALNYCFFNPRIYDIMAARRKIADAMPLHDVILMHGSVISSKEIGFMFAAPSGVGKSTRTRIWLEQYPESFVVDGDKPLVKITDSDVLAYGTPWCGKEGWNTNTMVPLKAIFLLERTIEGETDSINEININEAFPILIQQTHRPKDSFALKKNLKLLKSLDGKVRVYKYRSSPTVQSIKLAYETAMNDMLLT